MCTYGTIIVLFASCIIKMCNADPSVTFLQCLVSRLVWGGWRSPSRLHRFGASRSATHYMQAPDAPQWSLTGRPSGSPASCSLTCLPWLSWQAKPANCRGPKMGGGVGAWMHERTSEVFVVRALAPFPSVCVIQRGRCWDLHCGRRDLQRQQGIVDTPKT